MENVQLHMICLQLPEGFFELFPDRLCAEDIVTALLSRIAALVKNDGFTPVSP